ncbi:DUF5808 domain-containing protein [Maribellus sediminis]|uniref:DUF5808 domain-containing protein n=1 Tax=Maribellus sediminis TaxID=2696285 RepID=UPI0014301358|nr:DUF5808 domain-containing protein [Maribellus sediminis]
MKSKIEKELLDTMHKNPANWRGVFYFNRKDPRLTVPKITATGWTFNFASPWSYALIVAIILIIIASQYFV